MLATLTEQLARRQPLDASQVTEALRQLTNESVSAEAKADFLLALAAKPESVEEITAFAAGLRGLSVPVPIDNATRARGLLDVCGTGGDGLNTFNISTTVALVLAAAGVPVAKHGNRAVTSASGSADVLEALGVPIDLEPEEAARWLRERHFAFFFAPRYHPAFKHIVPARKLCAERGRRTIFNFLGPLLNPARPDAQLLGVPRPDLCATLARVLHDLRLQRGVVACGAVAGAAGHLDEFSTLGPTRLAEFGTGGKDGEREFLPGGLPLQSASLADLAGGDKAANAAIVRRILGGEERGPKRDAALLNSAAALYVAGRAASIEAGWDMAAQVIDSGAATKKLAELARR
jgi:anthranilate phosphoribosyltransferase